MDESLNIRLLVNVNKSNFLFCFYESWLQQTEPQKHKIMNRICQWPRNDVIGQGHKIIDFSTCSFKFERIDSMTRVFFTKILFMTYMIL